MAASDRVLRSSKKWAVLVAGATRHSVLGTEKHPHRDLTSDIFSIYTMAALYDELVARLGKERIVVIGLFQETLDFFEHAAATGVPEWGTRGEGTEASKTEYRKFLQDFKARCGRILEDGGADYDGADVNPTTLTSVLTGAPIRSGAKVIPRGSASSIFLAIASHGSNRQAVPEPRGVCDLCLSVHEKGVKYDHQHSSLSSNEWFFHLPYPATDLRPFEWVRLEGSCMDPKCPLPYGDTHKFGHHYTCVFWQHLFQAFHSIHEANPETLIFNLLQFCTSGGIAKFLDDPAFRQRHNVNMWPMLTITTAREMQGSLNDFSNHFLSALRRLPPDTPIKHLYKTAEEGYWKANAIVREMNADAPNIDQKFGEVNLNAGDSGVERSTISDVFHFSL